MVVDASRVGGFKTCLYRKLLLLLGMSFVNGAGCCDHVMHLLATVVIRLELTNHACMLTNKQARASIVTRT